MAIRKSKTLPNGATGNYWKIVGEVYDKVNKTCVWHIALFASKEVSDNAGQHLGLIKTFQHKATSEELSGDRTALGYQKIKEKAMMMVEYDISGKPIDPRPFDLDLCDGEDA